MTDRLYIDESGDHKSSHQTDIGKRYLGVIGVHFQQAAGQQFRRDLEAFKRLHLDYDEDDPPILHREDIVSRRGPFHVLRHPDRRRRFDDALIDLIGSTRYTVTAVVIDKFQHGQNRQLVHPYHYCLHAIIERYCGLLDRAGCVGDVIAESRGGVEDGALKRAYEELRDKGTQFCDRERCERTLTSSKLKLRPKGANIAGLQLADILAHPLTRDVLVAYKRSANRGSAFADRVCTSVECRYNNHPRNGHINGYGRVILS
jgi:hypothetical protein